MRKVVVPWPRYLKIQSDRFWQQRAEFESGTYLMGNKPAHRTRVGVGLMLMTSCMILSLMPYIMRIAKAAACYKNEQHDHDTQALSDFLFHAIAQRYGKSYNVAN